jgi:hypothetical protein
MEGRKLGMQISFTITRTQQWKVTPKGLAANHIASRKNYILNNPYQVQ